MAAVFFSIGAMLVTPVKIFNISTSYWDANEHWAASIAEQRADYIAGGLLLLLSFSLQLSAILVHSTVAPFLLQPFGCAIAEIVAVLTLLLVCFVLLRNAVSKTTKTKVRQLQQKESEAEELKAKVRNL